MRTAVYFSDIGDIDPTLLAQLYSSLPEFRRRKADSYQHDGRIQSVCAWALLMHALKESGIGRDDEFGITDEGKPYLKREGIEFSISHTAGRVMCVISDRPVGCDTERIAHRHGISERFFSEREKEQVSSSDDEDRTFCRIWTLKESYLKATGKGMSIPLDSFSIGLGDTVSMEPEKGCSFREYLMEDGFCYSACIMGGELPKDMINIDLKDQTK